MTLWSDIDAAHDIARMAFIEHGADWRSHIDADVLQWLSVYWHESERDTPGRRWSLAKAWHPAIYRFLKVDPADPVAAYAVAPFRVHADPGTGKARILAAWPCPRLIDRAEDHTGIEQVISWAPLENVAAVLDDPAPQLVGAWRQGEDTGCLFADPFTFFRAWVEARAHWAGDYLASRGQAWRNPPTERDEVPGCLMIGALEAIRWAPAEMPAALTCVGVDPRALNRAILKAARLPMAHAGTQMRQAA